MIRRLLIVTAILAIVAVALVAWLGGTTPERADRWSPPPATSAGAGDTNEGPAARATPATRRDEEGLARGAETAAEAASNTAPRSQTMDAGLLARAREALADPLIYETPHERAKRIEATRVRRWRNLNVVESLIVGITEGIEKAKTEGNEERRETLEATKARLETRRDALQAALDESDGAPR